MKFLWFGAKPGERSGPAGGIGVAEPPTAIEYVDWLLAHMLRTSQTKLLIDSAVPLPGAAETAPGRAPPCVPSAEAAINRLKVLSGLNPVSYPVPVEGTFEKARGSYLLVLATRFEDRADRSTCAIRLTVRSQAS